LILYLKTVIYINNLARKINLVRRSSGKGGAKQPIC
jgi:hypothetical protein